MVDDGKHLASIDERLQEVVSILKMAHRGEIEIAKKKLLESRLKKDIYEYCNGKHSVGEIAKLLGKHQPSVSRAIAELEETGLIREEKVGTQTFYQKIL